MLQLLGGQYFTAKKETTLLFRQVFLRAHAKKVCFTTY